MTEGEKADVLVDAVGLLCGILSKARSQGSVGGNGTAIQLHRLRNGCVTGLMIVSACFFSFPFLCCPERSV